MEQGPPLPFQIAPSLALDAVSRPQPDLVVLFSEMFFILRFSLFPFRTCELLMELCDLRLTRSSLTSPRSFYGVLVS